MESSAAAGEYPSPPASDAESGSDDGGSSSFSDDDGSSDAAQPPYTADELAAVVLDFYRFLATLHFDPAHLKVAPPGGWPIVAPRPGWKSDLVLDVLRRLPYFDGGANKAMPHYKCLLIDYSSLDDLTEFEYGDEYAEIWNDEGISDIKDVISLAHGHESFGRWLWLDVPNGLITEELCRAGQLPPEDIKIYFDKLKEGYRSLTLIASKGRLTIEAENVPERTGGPVITEEEVLAQTKEWGTDLDIHYLRQLYRELGWPDAFRRRDAEKAIHKLMEKMLERRNSDWDWFHHISLDREDDSA